MPLHKYHMTLHKNHMTLHKNHMTLHKYHMTLHKNHDTSSLVSSLMLKSLLQCGNQTMKMTSCQRFDNVSHIGANIGKFHVEIW